MDAAGEQKAEGIVIELKKPTQGIHYEPTSQEQMAAGLAQAAGVDVNAVHFQFDPQCRIGKSF